MPVSQEAPNPLRPYYIPPSIGLPHDTSSNTTGVSTHGVGLKNGSAASYASSAREIFSDIDYSEYLTDASPSSVQMVRNFLDELTYKYVTIILAQPFEVAKVVLQVKDQRIKKPATATPTTAPEVVPPNPWSFHNTAQEGGFDDSDADEPSYFTSSTPHSNPFTPPQSHRRTSSVPESEQPEPTAVNTSPSQQLVLKRADALFEVISQEWATEGAWGVWKGTNATFVYSILLKTIESWSRSMLSALFNVPDPSVMAGLGMSTDVLDAPYPWATLGVAVGAAAAAGLILAPLDIIRTRLILTPVTKKKSVSHNVRNLPSYFCPPELLIPTLLHSTVPPLISHSTPLFLRSQLSVDPVVSPATFSFATFLSSTVELFIKLPLETVLRRGQMQVASSPQYAVKNQTTETTVEVGPYTGVMGTMWSIVKEEGERTVEVAPVSGRASRKSKKAPTTTIRKGQGIEGLWRGWRVGVWGLFGMWVAKSMSNGGGGEF
ncbi:mitochondrial fusion protein-like protein [Xylogone sp. PMI_703]|nr:mitochondrial fusion protein-like protein [Xylogone sp. PMI_703]